MLHNSTLAESVLEPDEIGHVIEEVYDVAREISSAVDRDDCNRVRDRLNGVGVENLSKPNFCVFGVHVGNLATD
ncbi:hypothetical protein TNCV_975341 [Trichonephila clavipes]|nr:hypothetical protein TNCV_975341 [Trichonephila clavipes]